MSFKIFIISTISLILYPNIAFCRNNEDGENQIKNITTDPRIVGGFHHHPHTLAKYIVSIRHGKETAKQFGYSHFCAGTILAANKILTAAHCVYNNGQLKPASYLKVVAKTPKRLSKTENTQELNVKEIIYHSGFSETTLFNDIALLILEQNIKLDPILAGKIGLPQENIQPGRYCTVIGWGKIYMHGPLANDLLYANLYLHSRKYCRKKLPKFGSKKLCASDILDIGVDACFGDSGGPLICNDVVTGIVSYGYGCAWGQPGVYTNVFKFVEWIGKEDAQTSKPLLKLLVLNLILIVYLL